MTRIRRPPCLRRAVARPTKPGLPSGLRKGDSQPGWRELPEASRSLNRGSAALVLDLLAKADENGATAESYDWVVADFARVTGLSQTTANLFVSVVAAVKATLDKEMV